MSNSPTVPEDCPSCGRSLDPDIVSRVRSRNAVWQWKAKALLLSGSVVSGILVLCAFSVAAEVVFMMGAPQDRRLSRKERSDWALVALVWIGCFVVAIIPALAAGAAAARMRRKVVLRCRNCGWSGSFQLPTRAMLRERREEPDLGFVDEDSPDDPAPGPADARITNAPE